MTIKNTDMSDSKKRKIDYLKGLRYKLKRTPETDWEFAIVKDEIREEGYARGDIAVGHMYEDGSITVMYMFGHCIEEPRLSGAIQLRNFLDSNEIPYSEMPSKKEVITTLEKQSKSLIERLKERKTYQQ